MTFWIGNTADCGVSGLDERQAAGLLSAVGGNGLSLVEPGPATDPVAAGLNAAIDRARRAWERTQPQLVIDGWLDMLDEQDGLAAGEEPERGSAHQVTREFSPAASPWLTSGAEPSYAPPEGLAAVTSPCVAPSHGSPERGGSAPSNTTTAVAAHPVWDTRGDRQRGA